MSQKNFSIYYIICFIIYLSSHRSNSQTLKGDTFDEDIEQIFNKLTEIATLKVSPADVSQAGDLTKIQSFILKYSITLMPILLESKRYKTQKVSEFYIGFLQSKFVLQTQFLSKLIKSKLFESPEGRKILVEPLCTTLRNLLTIKSNYDEKKQGPVECRLEAVGKIITELMDVLENKNIGCIKENVNSISNLIYFVVNYDL